MELKDLAGAHQLSGVDMGIAEVDGWRGPEQVNALWFILDGRVFGALEDPGDDYRSSMKELVEAPEQVVANRFDPQPVLGVHHTRGRYSCDILELLDAKTGETVLRVGTDNDDDYYPWYVSEWSPKGLFVNQGAG